MSQLPDPLTPPGLDLTAFPFMPLHVSRLRDSDLAAEGSPEGNWYAVILWCAAWHQIPAGSLPDNETVLTKLCGLGRDVETFKRLRVDAMRGFILCNDGRWYHPTVSSEALHASTLASTRRDAVDARETRQQRWRNKLKVLSGRLRDAGIAVKHGAKHAELVALCEANNLPTDVAEPSVIGDTNGDGGETSPLRLPETDKTLQGQYNKESKKQSTTDSARERKKTEQPPGSVAKPNPRFQAFLVAAGMDQFPSDLGKMIDEWEAAGIDFDDDVLIAVRSGAKEARERGKKPFTARYFDGKVRERVAEHARLAGILADVADRNRNNPPHPDDLAAARQAGASA